MIVGRAVIEIDVPAMIAAEAVIPDGSHLLRIQQDQFRMESDKAIHVPAIRRPVAVTAPGIKSPVVACFEYRIKHIVIFDKVTSKAAIANIDARPRSMINTVMADSNSRS